jgi:glutathione S-transferase
MELRYGALSPYVRKVLVVAHELGVVNRIRLIPTSPREHPEHIVQLNPLGKIPTLITDSGAVLFDSPVICEFLDAEYGDNRLLPARGLRRWEIMTFVALADGVTDAAILARHERARPAEQQSADAIDWQLRKVRAGLDRFEILAETFGTVDMGQLALGCALGYIDVRLGDLRVLDSRPRLNEWYASASRRPSFQNTVPKL